ncbi:MAG: SDR family NAD(P)-dependent oxidoreductase [Leptospiraceae bacterium]|nr:SDR family NAD(P)-dependent oxidoreductase [Leptospiraceae bacterium]MDW7976311.1 SDR family NAD(P)-dependent oxidoreductase [Leptospiraceae bacterium]
MELKNKYALITGGSSGIGEALAYELASVGSIPILIARKENELKRVQSEISSRYGINSFSFPCDITSSSDRKNLKQFLEEFTKIDLLIHNAGITNHGKFEVSTEEALRKTFEINFFSVVEITRIVLPKMKSMSQSSNEKKMIVLVSTPSGLFGIPERFAYSSSKAAAQLFIESISYELLPYQIKTCIVFPGYTKTNLRKSGITSDGRPLDEEQEKNAKSPEEVAKIIVNAIQKEKKYAFTNLTGKFIFYGRVLFPEFLEKLILKKTAKN